MYGAIIGDIIGSKYEFHNIWTKDFPLFSEGTRFTDDTVLTIAVSSAVMCAGKKADGNLIYRLVEESLRDFGNAYRGVGYGEKTYQWILFHIEGPYYSYGNGSAMRVSSAGWLYDSLERTREIAAITAKVTHNHHEGIKGAEATASAIYMARTGASKDEIRAYITEQFHYNLDRHCDEIRPSYSFDATCPGTVPEAIIAFLDGESFESVLRLAVSLGGDSDTLTCIAGGIADAFYGPDKSIMRKAFSFLPDDLFDVVKEFDRMSGRKLL